MSQASHNLTLPFMSIILDENGNEKASNDLIEVSDYLDDIERRRLAYDSTLSFCISTVHFGHYSEKPNENYETVVKSMDEYCHPALAHVCDILTRKHMSKAEAAEHHQQAYRFMMRLPFMPYGRSWRATKRQFRFTSKHNAEGRHLAVVARQSLKKKRIPRAD